MNLLRASLLIAAIATPCVLLAPSCALKGFEIDTSPVDAGIDAPPGCDRASPQTPPVSDAGGGSIDFTVGVRSIDMGESKTSADAAAPPPGFDLDRHCTGAIFGKVDEGPSCSRPAWTKADQTDYARGIDNAGARLFAYVQTYLPPGYFGSEFYSNRANDGYWTILIRVSEYNGEADDNDVRVAIYTTSGRDKPDGGAANPLWDGSDVWLVNDTSTKNGNVDDPAYVTQNAYVTNHVLVATVPQSEIVFSGTDGSLAIRLTQGTIEAKIIDEGGKPRLTEGVLSARWKLTDVFQTLSSLSLAGAQLCNSGLFPYPEIKQELCKYTDILSSLGGPTDPCDALSFGMAFEAFPVQLGAVAPVVPTQNMCPPGQDPALDSCESLLVDSGAPDSGAGGAGGSMP